MSDLISPYIVDAVIQEIDIKTGELRFEWRASNHFRPEDGEYLKFTHDTHLDATHADVLNGRQTEPHEYFHMNSVAKDSEGNYLISIRYTHQIICVSGTTGEILWGFGGMASDFQDQDDGRASDFHWQHHARWIDDAKGILGLFDNGIAKNHWDDAPYSRGIIIHLDVNNKTASALHSYASLDHVRSTAQGSFQFLPRSSDNTTELISTDSAASSRDRVFIGWGSAAAFSLHDAESEELLCQTHYAASLFWYFEFAKSYRAIRAPKDWQARPEIWDPNVVVNSGKAYVSWNGGMEVKEWSLQRRNGHDQWLNIASLSREGFETAFELPTRGTRSLNSAFRIAALDGEGNVLRYSNTFTPSMESGFSLWVLLLYLGAIATILAFTFAILMNHRLWTNNVLLRSGTTKGRYMKLEAGSDGTEGLL